MVTLKDDKPLPKVKGNHVQCKLRRGNTETVSWIPQRYAKKHKYLKLKNDDGDWENGWQVIETWSVKPSAEVLARTEDYKHQREASDI